MGAAVPPGIPAGPDLHAVARGRELAPLWRDGTARVEAWDVLEVSTGARMGEIAAVGGGMYALSLDGRPGGSHPGLAAALAAARDASRRILH